MNVKKVVLVALAGLAIVTLQGCGGCDEDNLLRCTQQAGANAHDCKVYSTCFKTTDCCDHEQNGKKASELIAAVHFQQLLDALNECSKVYVCSPLS